jgi:L-asparaginase
MPIKLFITGGTIDSEKYFGRQRYVFDKTHIPEILSQSRCVADIDSEIIMLKNSYYMDDSDREKILQSCKNCKENKIIVTHGTDTMTQTAKILGENIKNKTIILFGAMVPYNQVNSDALFNLGFAISSVQYLPKGVYIAMNGKVFTWDKVKKDKKLGLFKETKLKAF